MTEAPRPSIAIVTVGDELLTGDIVDRHSAWLSRHLTTHGYQVDRHVSAGDAPGALRRALVELPPDVAIVLIVGGLGPTVDDRTRAEVAAAAGVETEFRSEAWAEIERFFRSIDREPVPQNRLQAYFPQGAVVVDNRFGTAPGFRLTGPNDADWWALPGVPHELHGLFAETVLPALLSDHPPLQAGALSEYRFFGIPESELDRWLVEQVPPEHHQGIHLCCGDGELRVRLEHPDALDEAAYRDYGERFLGVGADSLAARVVAAAATAGQTIAVAESCTGGLLGARLTDVPGASRALAGGWIVYSNELKAAQLRVPQRTLEQHGAVSGEVARAMAAGARSAAASDVAVAITGIAGPGGGSEEKPVGTVFLGVATATRLASQRLALRGERDRIRSLAANNALFALLRVLRGSVLPHWEHDDPGVS